MMPTCNGQNPPHYALALAVVAGNYIEIKGIPPAWATNPLTTIYGGYIYME